MTNTPPLSLLSVDRPPDHAIGFARSHGQTVVDALPLGLVALNDDFRIVFANPAALSTFGQNSLNSLLGRSPGEVLNCVDAEECTGACGTVPHCHECGIFKAADKARRGEYTGGDCRIIQRNVNAPFQAHIWASAYEANGQQFRLVVFTESGPSRRDRALDHIQARERSDAAEELLSLSPLRSSTASESMLPQVHPSPVRAIVLLGELTGASSPLAAFHAKSVAVHPAAEDRVFSTDTTILTRVLRILLLYALKSSPDNACITLNCASQDRGVLFSLHLPQLQHGDSDQQSLREPQPVLLPTEQDEVRSLIEQCLEGKSWVDSVEGEGTTIFVALPERIYERH